MAMSGTRNRLKLRFDAPADTWWGASPLGDGLLGVMMPGGVGRDWAHLNHSTFWSGSPGNRILREMPVVAGGAGRLAEGRRLAKEGDLDRAEQEIRQAQGHWAESFLPLGRADWTLWVNGLVPEARSVTKYVRELDLVNGELSWSFVFGGARIIHHARVDRVSGDLIVDVTGPAQVPLRMGLTLSSSWRTRFHPDVGSAPTRPAVGLSVEAPSTVPPPHEESEPSYTYQDGQEAGMAAAFAARIVGDRLGSWTSTVLTGEGTGHIRLVIAATTGYRGAQIAPDRDGPELARFVLSSTDDIARGDAKRQRLRHRSQHRSLFDTFSLDLGGSLERHGETTTALIDRADGDPRLVALAVQTGRYLLLSSSATSEQGLPAGLQGIWNENPRPLWSSGYTTNINLQMNYWAAGPANLVPTITPLEHWMAELASNGHRIAVEDYGVDGWLAHHNSDAWAYATQVGSGNLDLEASFWPYGGAWLALTLWDRYTFTEDLTWLREVAWPVLEGAGRAVAGLLIEEADGTMSTGPSASPENVYRDAQGRVRALHHSTTTGLEITRLLFEAIHAAGEAIGVSAEQISAYDELLGKLVAPGIDRLGRLLEWGHEETEVDVAHRHLSHLVGLYPGWRSIDTDPAYAAAARNALNHRGDRGTAWALIWRAALRTRLREGEAAAALLSSFLVRAPETATDTRSAGVYGNLLSTCPPFQIDASLGFPAVVCDMLVQSHAGEIHLLPALPHQWSRGFVRGLRARPGVVVDLEWEHGRPTRLTLKSARARDVTIRIDENRQVLNVPAGRARVLYACSDGLLREKRSGVVQ